MGSEEKNFNEMLKSLERGRVKRSLHAPRPIQTQKTPCTSWNEIRKGFQLKSIKGNIPAESVPAPVLTQKKESDLVHAVESLLEANEIVVDPEGLKIQLNVPDRDPEQPIHRPGEDRTLEFRAKHLCGGHNYKFDPRRAKYAGCIVETLTKPAIIAEGNGKRFYLRRYKDGTLHIVIVSKSLEGISVVEGTAYQGRGELVTQYPNIPPQNKPEEAQVVYKNERLLCKRSTVFPF